MPRPPASLNGGCQAPVPTPGVLAACLPGHLVSELAAQFPQCGGGKRDRAESSSRGRNLMFHPHFPPHPYQEYSGCYRETRKKTSAPNHIAIANPGMDTQPYSSSDDLVGLCNSNPAGFPSKSELSSSSLQDIKNQDPPPNGPAGPFCSFPLTLCTPPPQPRHPHKQGRSGSLFSNPHAPSARPTPPRSQPTSPGHILQPAASPYDALPWTHC